MNVSELITLLQGYEADGKGNYRVNFVDRSEKLPRNRIKAVQKGSIGEHGNSKTIIINR